MGTTSLVNIAPCGKKTPHGPVNAYSSNDDMTRRSAMKKFYWMLTLLAVFALGAHSALAEGADIPKPQFPAEYAEEFTKAEAALKAHTPGTVVDFAVRERDDGREEWDLFFVLGGQLGEGEVIESDYTVRNVRLYDMPEGGLSAAQAVRLLRKEKGDLQIVDLELDRDNGRLRYEGEATLDGKRYEFEISVEGELIEWERD